MPTHKPFPSQESKLNSYFQIVVAYLTLHYTRLHVSEEHKMALNEALEEWNTVFPLVLDLNYRTKLIVANKNRLKLTLMTTLRTVFADIPKSALTPEDRIIFDLPERKTTRSRPTVPTTYPLGRINTNTRFQHTISFTDQDGSIGKPKGVKGCQIWYKMGAYPTDLKELTYLATDSATPYLHKFNIADAGTTVHYYLRWENSRGETGPWSPVINAMVNM